MEPNADSPTPHEPLSADERAELERLRKERELAAAQTSGDQSPTAPKKGGHWGRTVAAVILIALGCTLVPLSVTSVWARSMVTDTDRYVDTVAPLAEDPVVQRTITTNITRRIFTYIDIKDLTTQTLNGLSSRAGLPPEIASQLPALSGPISTGIENFTRDQVGNVVQSDAFAKAWEEANRIAHEQVVAFLTGESDAVTLQGNSVSINMAPIVEAVKQRLIASGFQLADKIPAVDTSFVIFQSDNLPKVQRGFDALNTLGFWLPPICLLLIGLGIYIAHNHRRAFIGAGIGVAIAMLIIAIVLQILRSAYLDSVPSDILPADAAAILYDSLVRFLREAIRSGVLIGIIVAAGAFLIGPSVTATTVRRGIVYGVTAIRRGLYRIGLHMEGVTNWVASYSKVLRVVTVAVAFVILFLVTYRTPALVIWLTVGVLGALFIIQLLGTRGGPPISEGEDTDMDVVPESL